VQRNTEVRADVRVGDAHVSIQRQSSSSAVEAGILGVEASAGVTKVYLDRLVHAPWESKIGSWACCGAVTTILSMGTDEGGTR